MIQTYLIEYVIKKRVEEGGGWIQFNIYDTLTGMIIFVIIRCQNNTFGKDFLHLNSFIVHEREHDHKWHLMMIYLTDVFKKKMKVTSIVDIYIYILVTYKIHIKYL